MPTTRAAHAIYTAHVDEDAEEGEEGGDDEGGGEEEEGGGEAEEGGGGGGGHRKHHRNLVTQLAGARKKGDKKMVRKIRNQIKNAGFKV
jgi:hypothetical protein